MKIQSFGETHIGRVRSSNQDAILADEALALFAVADGIGGLPDGAFASNRVLELIRHSLLVGAPDARNLAKAVREANRQVFAEGRRRHPEVGVGTTLTIGCLSENQLTLAHAGDSCAILLRGGDFRRLTREHTVAAEIQGRSVAIPDDSLDERSYHMLTRCLGESEELDLDFFHINIRPGDRLLFATDGLTKVCERLELRSHLTDALSAEDAVRRLIRAVLSRGAPDNIGLVAVFLS